MYPLPIIPLSPSSHNLLQPNANLIDPPYSSFTADGIVFCERYEYFAMKEKFQISLVISSNLCDARL